MTITVDVINSGAITLLQDLERLNLIRVGVPENPAVPEGRLSGRFAGALHLSDEKYGIFQNTLQQGRAEWVRDTY